MPDISHLFTSLPTWQWQLLLAVPLIPLVGYVIQIFWGKHLPRQGDWLLTGGMGVVMLITVYMDNATNNTREKFDRLWKYYNSFLNSNGLMHWKIDGFSGIAGQNAATDAEMDVAAALLQAHKQWGDQKYLDDARAIIEKIWNHEVNANGYLKPGDTWDSKKNPSYFSTAALESFKRYFCVTSRLLH